MPWKLAKAQRRNKAMTLISSTHLKVTLLRLLIVLTSFSLFAQSTHAQTNNSILEVSTGMNEEAVRKALDAQGYKLVNTQNYSATRTVPAHMGKMFFEKDSSAVEVKLSPVSGKVMYIGRKDVFSQPVAQDALVASLNAKYGKPTNSFPAQQRMDWRYTLAGKPVNNFTCYSLTNISRNDAFGCSIAVYASMFGNPVRTFNLQMWDYRIQAEDIRSQDKLDSASANDDQIKAGKAPLPKL